MGQYPSVSDTPDSGFFLFFRNAHFDHANIYENISDV